MLQEYEENDYFEKRYGFDVYNKFILNKKF